MFEKDEENKSNKLYLQNIVISKCVSITEIKIFFEMMFSDLDLN